MSSSYFFEYVMEAVNSDSENESPEHLESGIKRKRKEESTDQIHCLKQKVKRLRLRLEEQREHCRMEVQAAYDLNSFKQVEHQKEVRNLEDLKVELRTMAQEIKCTACGKIMSDATELQTECEKEEPTDETHHFKQELEAMEEELGKVKMDKAKMEIAVEKQKEKGKTEGR